MILVTHLLGTGHLARALTLAEAFQAAGHSPVVVSGGMPVARLAAGNVKIMQVPPVRSNGVDFSQLLDQTGAICSGSFLAERQTQLLDFVSDFEPDALLTELFPFGRRILKEEFLAVLKAAKTQPNPPVVFASIRDILAPPSAPKKVILAEDILGSYYDGVLVHSAANMTPLDLSWPVSDTLRPMLRYTGFVAPAPATGHPNVCGAGEVIVSAGGGDVGQDLFRASLAAAQKDPSRIWRILVGGQKAQAVIADLRQDAPDTVIIEAARSDFRQMLHHAAASVSFCGYNTALDILQTTCPAVFVPFDEGGEVEQGLRAAALAQHPGIERLSATDLSAERLLARLETALSVPRAPADHTQMLGADETVRIVAQAQGAKNGD